MSERSTAHALQPAYILHYTPWRESSFIVDAFTLERGRLGLVAKGARASKPRVRALYQPFRPLLLSWVGGGDLRTVTGIEDSGQALDLTDAALACGYYLNELVLRLLGKDQPQPSIFAYYAASLADLSMVESGREGQASLERILRLFELQLLDTLGVLPDLAFCTPDGSRIDAQREYVYHPANAVAVPTSRPVSDGQSLGIQKLKNRMGEGDGRDPSIQADGMTPDAGVRVSGSTLLALSRLEIAVPVHQRPAVHGSVHDGSAGESLVLDEARRLMRQILRVHLGERPLQSRALFESLARRE